MDAQPNERPAELAIAGPSTAAAGPKPPSATQSPARAGAPRRRRLAFAVVIPPHRLSSLKSRQPKPTSAPPAPQPAHGTAGQKSSNSTLAAASGSNGRLALASSKPTSQHSKKRPRIPESESESESESADDEADESEGEREGQKEKHLKARKIDKGKGRATESALATSKGGPSKNGKERERAVPTKERAKKRTKRRESRSEDEDDLELSGKETIVEERFRPKKSAPKGMDKYREARAEKQKQEAKARRVIRDSDDESPPLASTSRGGNPVKVKRAVPKFAGGQATSEAESSGSDDSSGSEEDSSSSEEGEDKNGNLKGMMASDDEDDAAKEAREATYLSKLIAQVTTPKVDWSHNPDHDDFKVASKWVHRQLTAAAETTVSPKWRRDFRRCLDNYPRFGILEMTPEEEAEYRPRCDACPQPRHKSSLLGVVRGHPYDRETFKRVADTFAFSDDEDSKNAPPRREGEFTLGTTCARNAELYHELTHWRFTTYTALTTLLLGDPKDSEEKRKKSKIHQPIKKHADQDNQTVSIERRMALRHAYRDRCVTESARCIAKLKANGKIRTLTKEFENLLQRSRDNCAKD
ncbi:hypothetical protein RQP46_006466 [Phenoliferia psychrophenolica]